MDSLPSRVPGVLGNTSLDRFDAVIVGSGAGGSAVARVLATNGLSVCILEYGSNYFDGLDDPRPGFPIPRFSNDEIKMSARALIGQQVRIDPQTFRRTTRRERDFVGDANFLPKTVGGAAVHSDVKYPRYVDFDFRMRSLLGDLPDADWADWPLDYGELEPFYAACERLVGVAGEAGANPFESPRSGPFPLPAVSRMYVDLVLSEGARKLGLTPFPYPAAQAPRPWRGRPPCNDCGFCSGYGCATNAKGSPAVTTLRDALLTGRVQLRHDCVVTRLATDAARRRITAVEYLDPSGRAATVAGDRYVLAANAVESARLCFLSDPGGPGLGNSSGLVGRNLMCHYQTIAVGFYAEDFHGERGKSVSGGFADFRGVPGDPARPLGGIVEFGTNSEKVNDALQYMQTLGLRGPALKRLLAASPFQAHIGVLIMQGEDTPQAGNRVDLDPAVRDVHGHPCARVTYEPHAMERASRDHYGPKLVDLHRAAGARFGLVAPEYEGEPAPRSRHVMGTLRCGDDPRTSVTDRTCRFHDVENLWAADGSVFPTGSGYNPTLTIQTMALRTAGLMVAPERPETVVERDVAPEAAR